MENEELAFCPNCKGKNIITGQKGFSLGKAAAGGILLGPLGLLAGTHKSKEIKFTCLDCGNKFTIEELMAERTRIAREAREKEYRDSLSEEERREYDEEKAKDKRTAKIFAIIFFIVMMIAIVCMSKK